MKITKTKLILAAVFVLLFLCLIFSDALLRTYVRINHERLEKFSQNALDGKAGERYGLWDVDAWPEKNMVEFHTGSIGLVPSNTYWGFYYSSDNTHLPFQGADVPVNIDGDSASWTDGTDNRGSSTRILERWFWFEAHF